MKNYVVGFLISFKKDKVVLIEKKKPDWQKGKLNGIGGSIEPGEFPLDAMIREFEEEAGVKTKHTHWIRFCHAEDKENNIQLHLFKCFDYNDEFIDKVRTVEEERIGLYWIEEDLYKRTVPNLKVFIPMALNPDFTFSKITCKLR